MASRSLVSSPTPVLSHRPRPSLSPSSFSLPLGSYTPSSSRFVAISKASIAEICARFVLHRLFRGVMAFSNDASDSAAAKEGGRKRKRSESEWRPPPTKWRTQTEQRSYSSKLLEALRRVRRSTPTEEARRRNRALREAADRALAVAARGRTRWSRAILSSRRLKIKPRRPQPAVPSASLGGCAAAKKKRSPVIEGKAAVLGRLVPGCQRISFPSLLEEASDYIPALEMQVRAMAALVAILSASSGSSSTESDHTAP